MSGFAKEDLSCDAFLGGRLHLLQPRHGYRAGVDPVLLAASVPAQSGQTVLELGCGVGAAILCLSARIDGLRLTGVEKQPDIAELARRNGGDRLEVITADLRDMPLDLRQRQFDHVIANPPYFDRATGNAASDQGRETAMGEATPLSIWLKVAAKRVAPKGYVTFIHHAERLGDLLVRDPYTAAITAVDQNLPRDLGFQLAAQGRDVDTRCPQVIGDGFNRGVGPIGQIPDGLINLFRGHLDFVLCRSL